MADLTLVSSEDIAETGKPAKEVKEGPPAKLALIPLVTEEEEIGIIKTTREPAGAKPIIPKGDGCCIGVCTYLNNEIEGVVQAIKIRQDDMKYMGRGGERVKTKRQIAALTNRVSALKDIRVTLKEKKVCRCIE